MPAQRGVAQANKSYRRPLTANAAPAGCRLREWPSHPPGQQTFAVLRRRWVVDSTLAGLSRFRGLGPTGGRIRRSDGLDGYYVCVKLFIWHD